ncbi:Exopolyphosphatase-related protein [Candidatus Terasakiella magnetica]|uniref:Exopolyphosphatase-related protein n=1 Tax=Candidatus Terasakiella magnetica TaxID=1867952 RepID=A0A1C3RKZ7_9PROT|nr:exopolyphosphatase [Candidatus Terasakiella magnetica]SCA58002.1 Exopolyphosphatase-related protein [Candidatus Terasakiella magnetica]
MGEKFRLVTRSDFDGLVCAVLLKKMDLIDDITFVHPKDMQDGKVAITDRDITTNLPYVEGVHLAFDHHLSETLRVEDNPSNHIIDPDAPSAARVVWKYYGGHGEFPSSWDEMMEAVDKGDAARFNREEILKSDGWVLLNFLMDARTGLGRFRDFRISNYQLMMDLIESCATMSIEEILEISDVKERVDMYKEHEPKFIEQLQRCSEVHDNVVVLDLREEDIIYTGNRFMIYALYPDTNISIHVLWGLKKQNTVFACGKSILNKGSGTNVGELMLKYDGGGHENAGTCQVPNDKAVETLGELIKQMNADG